MKSIIESRHLLKHPYYQAWECGMLPASSLQHYAAQYFHHVQAFPRYLSAIHSQMKTVEERQSILENLIDEERGTENHPELWLRFAEGMGITRQEVMASQPEPAVRNIMETFLGSARNSAAQGLGALYAYESQVPQIAEFKIAALKKFYLQNQTPADQQRTLRFFEVHRQADVYHTEAVESLINGLPAEQKAEAEVACKKAADALWSFLDSMPIQA